MGQNIDPCLQQRVGKVNRSVEAVGGEVAALQLVLRSILPEEVTDNLLNATDIVVCGLCHRASSVDCCPVSVGQPAVVEDPVHSGLYIGKCILPEGNISRGPMREKMKKKRKRDKCKRRRQKGKRKRENGKYKGEINAGKRQKGCIRSKVYHF